MTDLVRRTAPRVALALLLLLAVLAVTAGAHAISGSSSAATSPAVLHWANEGISDLYTLDPARGPDFNARQATQLIYGGLVRFGPKLVVVPDVADHWRVSADGRTYTFYLRPQVRFADGTLLTASDVAYSLNRVLSPRYADESGAWLLSDIVGADQVMAGHSRRASGIRTVGPHVLTIRLHAPSGSFLAKLANPPGYIVPWWRVRQDPAHWDQHAFGTGPFKVARWVHNNALLLVPNPHYYAGRLKITGIDMPFVPEPLDAYKRYRAGAVDLMGTVHFPSDVLYDVRGLADFHRSPRLETVFLSLNEHVRPLGDPRVREALFHAVDRRALVSRAYSGFAHPTTAMMPPNLPGAATSPAVRGYNPGLAQRLLAQAGYPGGRGLPEITYPVDQDAQSVILATALADQWRATLGVRVRPVQYTHSAYLDLLQRSHFGIAVIDWTADYPDPENFVSQQFQGNSPNNNGAWHSTTFDRLTHQADAMEVTDPLRARLYQRAEALAMTQAAAIPLVNPYAGILLRSTVEGLEISGGYVLARNWTQVTVDRQREP